MIEFYVKFGFFIEQNLKQLDRGIINVFYVKK